MCMTAKLGKTQVVVVMGKTPNHHASSRRVMIGRLKKGKFSRISRTL